MLRNLGLLSLGLITLISSPQLLAEDIQCEWNRADIVVNGWANDWQDARYNYFDDEQSAIAIRNDATNLYLVFLTRDQSYLPLVARRGVTFWFNREGNKDRKLGVNFRRPFRMERPSGREMPERDFFGDEDRPRIDTTTSLALLFDDKREEIPIMESESADANSVLAAATLDNGNYCCELRIPLSVLAPYQIALDDLKSGKLGLGIESEKPQRPDGPGGPPGGGGFGGGMRGGGMPGGGMPPGGGGFPGGRPGGEFQMPKQLKLWVKVIPAVPEEK